jgi:preprotein translocase subunit YajC
VISAAWSFQNIPPAPGQPAASPAKAETAAPGAPSGQHAAEPSTFGMLLPILLLVPFVLLLMFSSRSQAKKQAAAIAGLKKGDRVLIQGGMVGKLQEIGDRYAKVEIAPGVKIEVLKSGLLGKDNAETAAAVEKK